ncbi:hypothetical protein FRB94_004456 [Tulasnella sp. JGI-2019a]|nr:hypothetical protein FRB93_001255 [Tulasnella sp. JGI-2019a]KAG8984836.1 hypothetical protein FRB94_004456 [Tulasnella sp. JGI-2019a]
MSMKGKDTETRTLNIHSLWPEGGYPEEESVAATPDDVDPPVPPPSHTGDEEDNEEPPCHMTLLAPPPSPPTQGQPPAFPMTPTSMIKKEEFSPSWEEGKNMTG